MLAAWDPLDAASRERFRRETGVDDATWARGRGWALSVAAMALPYYRDNNPGMFRFALRLVDEVMTDLGRNG